MTAKALRPWGYEGITPNPDIQVDIMYESSEGYYDWSVAALLRRWHGQADGAWQYAAYIDQGCSCSSPYADPPSGYDLVWDFEVDGPVKLIHTAINKSYYLTDGEKVEEKTKLNRVKNAIKYPKD